MCSSDLCDLTATDVFALQDEITERVATTIGEMYGVITRVELQRVRSRNTTNLESCECLPHAYEYQRLLTPDEHYFARDRLEDVVENDPDYADAWAVPAWIYADVHWGAFRSEEHTSELQSRRNLVCRLLLEKKKKI